MADREKVIAQCEWAIKQTSPIIIESKTFYEETLAILKEQEPYISKETRLNRDEYCRVGDILDCFDGMDMKADEVFHAVCLIEWAMSKRSVPHDQLLKEHDPVKPRVSSFEQRCGNCNKIIEMDGWKACPWCGKPIDWESWWSEHEAYRRR